MKKKYFFVLNPASNHGKSRVYIKHLHRILSSRKSSFDYDFRETENLSDAASLSEMANKEGYDFVIAVGGDGTINRVINGFYNNNGKRISQAGLGVIHTGTSPDFCLSYGVPTNPFEALDTIFNENIRKISVGRVEFPTSDVRYFSCCANIGLGASVARYANSGIRKHIGDFSGTIMAIIASLIKFSPSTISVVADGRKYSIRKNFNSFVGKTDFVASGMKILNDLKPDDKKMYLLSIYNVNWKNLLPLLRTIYSGNPIKNSQSVSFDYASEIQFQSENSRVEVEFDGDPYGCLPCNISVAEDLLDLIVKREV